MKNLTLAALVVFGLLFAFAVGLDIGEDIGKTLCRRPVATVQPIQDSITLIGGDTATMWTSHDEGKTWHKVDWMDDVESITAKSRNVTLTPETVTQDSAAYLPFALDLFTSIYPGRVQYGEEGIKADTAPDTTSFLPMAFYGDDSLIRTTHHDVLGWHPFDTLKCQKCYRRRNCWPLNKINKLDTVSEVIEYSR